MMDKIEALEKALAQERQARETAEDLLEEKSRETYKINKKLKDQNFTLQSRNQTLELFALITDLAEKNYKTEVILQKYIEGVCFCTGWALAHAFVTEEISSEKQKLTCKDIWYSSKNKIFDSFIEESKNETYQAGDSISWQVLKSSEPLWFDNFSEQEKSNRAKVAKEVGIIQAIAVPIMRYGKIVAVTEFFSDTYDSHAPNITNLVLTVGNHLSTILERRLSEKKVKDSYNKLKSTKMQLIQSSKLAAIGELAAGVAHEINNPIAYVLGNTQILEKYAQKMKQAILEYDTILVDEQQKELAEKIKKKLKVDYIFKDLPNLMIDTLEGLDRVTDIVTNLKNYSRVEQEEKQITNVNECIESTIKMIWNQVKYTSELEKDLSPLPDIECYPGRLNQVFMNLIVNANQAMEDQGKIGIKSYVKDDMIIIEISDTGPGIPEEIQDKIFDPFFTTKDVGKGTGLGLSISYEIIQQHGGSLELNTAENEGTTFIIKLPI